MSFVRLHKSITYLIAGLGLYALSLGGELGTGTLLALAAGYVVSLFFDGPILQRREWQQVWNIAVLGLLLLQLTRSASGAPILMLGVEFAAFLQISRLFNRRTAADHQQIAVLALLHLIAATILSVELGFAFAFVGFVVVTPWMLALSQLRREIEGTGTEGPESEQVQRVLRSQRIVGGRFLAGTAMLTVPIFALTLALFLMFPRVGLGFLSLSSNVGHPTTGFGRNVELGGFGTLRTDPTIVLRYWPQPETPGPHAPRRFRGTSFDRYDGRAWSRTDSASQPVTSSAGYHMVARLPRPLDRRLEVELEAIDEPVVFLPDGAVALELEARFEGATRIGRRLTEGPGLDLRYDPEQTSGLRYTVFVSTASNEMMAAREASMDAYLQLPDDAPDLAQIRRLAEEVTKGATSDRERADRIQSWLRDSGEFEYSMTLPDTQAYDPLAVFLFQARYGHCEYFSTALAVMLRTLGVPTRNVTGFVGGRFNPYGGYYAISQGDAHSWVEVFVDDRWRTYDPTPPARGQVASETGLLAELRAIVDAVRSQWLQNVVGYDLERQISILSELRALMSSLSEPESSPEARGQESRSMTSSLAPWLLLVPLLALLFGGAWWFRASLVGRNGADSDATQLYRDLEKALRRRGVPRPPHVTPLEHAEHLAREGFEAAGVVRQITQRYLEARFGEAPLTPKERGELQQKVAEVGRRQASV